MTAGVSAIFEPGQTAAHILATVGTKPPTVDGSSVELPVDDGPAAAMEALRRYLDDRSSIVKTCAIQALAELSFGNRAMEEEMVELLEHFRVTGTAAMKARSRKLLQHLQKNKKFIG